jgi:hypothetical protein
MPTAIWSAVERLPGAAVKAEQVEVMVWWPGEDQNAS